MIFLENPISTNIEAKAYAKRGCDDFTLLWADAQQGGYGKYGRPWVSAKGNAFMSFVLYPQKPLFEAAQLTFIAALAVGAFLERVLPKEKSFGYKWPNDVLIGHEKIAGILLESETGSEQNPFVIVGIGVNVKSAPKDLPYKATCLEECGVYQSAEEVVRAIKEAFFEKYMRWKQEGFDYFLKAFEEKMLFLNQMKTFIMDEKQIDARLCGLDSRGGIIVEDQSGIKQTLYAGDLFFKEQKVEQ